MDEGDEVREGDKNAQYRVQERQELSLISRVRRSDQALQGVYAVCSRRRQDDDDIADERSSADQRWSLLLLRQRINSSSSSSAKDQDGDSSCDAILTVMRPATFKPVLQRQNGIHANRGSRCLTAGDQPKPSLKLEPSLNSTSLVVDDDEPPAKRLAATSPAAQAPLRTFYRATNPRCLWMMTCLTMSGETMIFHLVITHLVMTSRQNPRTLLRSRTLLGWMRIGRRGGLLRAIVWEAVANIKMRLLRKELCIH